MANRGRKGRKGRWAELRFLANGVPALGKPGFVTLALGAKGLVMHRLHILRRAAAAAAICLAAPLAWAAAPDGLDADLMAPAASTPVQIHELETEMVVHDWVLCISQAVAEELARAREESDEKAKLAYAALSESRACGRFAEMRVILRERLYTSAASSGHDARVFEALVNLSDNWASAFVVYGGLPAE